MAKYFNTRGWCNSEVHFVADTSHKLKQVLQLIENKEYFTINRPHQYGKTSMLRLLGQTLTKEKGWLVLSISFEGTSSSIFEDKRLFCKGFLRLLSKQLIEHGEQELAKQVKNNLPHIENLLDLSDVITELVTATPLKIVLLIDEVDSSSNQKIFLEFLGLLRHKFLNRTLITEKTFHNVVLVGIHDIKTLKLKIRTPGSSKITYNSPWNIAADFKINMNLQKAEVMPMLKDYCEERKVTMNIGDCTSKLVYYTSGYPFLLSALCKIIDEEILPNKNENSWLVADVDEAARLLITARRSNTNFDHLIKVLENNEDLYQLVFDLLIENEHFDFNIQDPVINLGILYGVFDIHTENGLKVHNRIYSELIFNYMTSKLRRQVSMQGYDEREDYLLPNNQLNLPKVLDRFQQFMQEQENKKDKEFLERNGTLLFLGFLQPIINGKGYAFKEVKIAHEKRTDIILTYYQHKYIIELKIWRGPKKHRAGLKQLSDYLKKENLDKGYLLVFDFRKRTKSRDKKWLKSGKKEIYGVWV